MMGMGESATARTTCSSLKAHRSSSEPPPRAKRMTSGQGWFFHRHSPLQIVDYNYNVRGWLKGINDVSQLVKGTNPKDLFAFQLNYNDITDVSKKLFNGNISQAIWASSNDDLMIRNYVYTYDALNRLKSATDNAGRFNEDNIQYDKNGNILKLKRQGSVVSSPNINISTDYGLMDDLTYTYDAGNKLMKVSDAAPVDQFGFKDDAVNATADTADDYTYDGNGNMLTDANKGITTNITYNHLGLPTKIVFPTGNIVYLYDAVGQKVQKVVMVNSPLSTTTTEYLGGFQYKRINSGTTDLQFFPTAEGYVANNAGVLSYVFQFKDHLGNIRLSYAKNTSSNLLEIIEENNYYPFGLEHQGYNNSPKITFGNAIAEQYKYNGQELQDELGLNVTAMDYRQYDSSIGRFTSIDLLSELAFENSGYNYAYNNPNYFNDPTGLFGEEFIEGQTNKPKPKPIQLQEVVVKKKSKKNSVKTFSSYGYVSIISTKYISNKDVQNYFNILNKDLERLSAIYGGGSALTGGSALELKSLKDYKELIKKLVKEKKLSISNPALLAIGTIMGIRAGQLSDLADKLMEIQTNYNNLNSSNNKIGAGIYIKTESNSIGTMGGSGSMTRTTYYDTSTNKIIGATYEHY